ncbi:unnamed protein product, partial [Coccothraustes coccothraustes]
MSKPHSKAARHRRSQSDNYCFHFSLRLLSFPGEESWAKRFFRKYDSDRAGNPFQAL